MKITSLTEKQLQKAIKMIDDGYTKGNAAQATGVNRKTLRAAMAKYSKYGEGAFAREKMPQRGIRYYKEVRLKRRPFEDTKLYFYLQKTWRS